MYRLTHFYYILDHQNNTKSKLLSLIFFVQFIIVLILVFFYQFMKFFMILFLKGISFIERANSF